MRYLQRNSMMTQHVPLQLMMQNSKPRLPLTGIVVGPCRHKEVSRISVGDLLTPTTTLLPMYFYTLPRSPIGLSKIYLAACEFGKRRPCARRPV